MSQKGPPSSSLIFCNRLYVNKSQRATFYIFWHYATFSERKKIQTNVLFTVGEKSFLSLIEHERHPLGVSKLFSELFAHDEVNVHCSPAK